MRARVVVIPEENGEFLLFSFGRIVLVLNFLLRILNMKWPNTTYKYTFSDCPPVLYGRKRGSTPAFFAYWIHKIEEK